MIKTIQLYAAAGLIAVLNLIHPFIHSLEGGSLDSILEYTNAWAAHVISSLRTTNK